MLSTHTAKLSDIGKKRAVNQDFAEYFEPEDPEERRASGCLYLVADGVGGAAKGERASRYAVEKVLYDYYQSASAHPGERLRKAMRQAGNDIFRFAEENEGNRRMATTMVAAAIWNDRLVVANVGDSRAYLIRDGQAQQISQDHSYVGEMLREGLLNEQEAMQTRGKNKLTRSLGGEENTLVDVFPDITLQPDDRILLCTDGLTRYALTDDIIRMAADGEPAQVVQKLIHFANEKGGADNVSAILVHVGTGEAYDVATTTDRSRRPAPVDLDTLVTEPVPVPAARRSPLPLDRTEMILAITALVLLIVVCVLGATLVFGYLIKPQESPANLPSASPSPTSQLPATPTPDSIQEGAFPPASPAPGSSILPTIQAAPVITQTITIPYPAPVVTQTLQTCEYTIMEGESINLMLERFEITGTSYSDILDPNNAGYDPTNNYHVEPGWVLWFPSVDTAICEQQGGIPIPPEAP